MRLLHHALTCLNLPMFGQHITNQPSPVGAAYSTYHNYLTGGVHSFSMSLLTELKDLSGFVSTNISLLTELRHRRYPNRLAGFQKWKRLVNPFPNFFQTRPLLFSVFMPSLMDWQPIFKMNRGFAFFVKNPYLKAFRQQFQTGKKFCGRFSPVPPLFFRSGIKFFHRAFISVRLARDNSFPQFMFNAMKPTSAKRIFAVIADGLSKNSGDCDLFIRQTPSTMTFDFLPPHKN